MEYAEGFLQWLLCWQLRVWLPLEMTASFLSWYYYCSYIQDNCSSFFLLYFCFSSFLLVILLFALCRKSFRLDQLIALVFSLIPLRLLPKGSRSVMKSCCSVVQGRVHTKQFLTMTVNLFSQLNNVRESMLTRMETTSQPGKSVDDVFTSIWGIKLFFKYS